MKLYKSISRVEAQDVLVGWLQYHGIGRNGIINKEVDRDPRYRFAIFLYKLMWPR